MTIEELTANIRPYERKKMQFILIGKLDNISISCIISEKKLKNLNRTLGFLFFKNLNNLNSDFLGFLKKPRFLKTCQTALLPCRFEI